jgi:hypothetical protein
MKLFQEPELYKNVLYAATRLLFRRIVLLTGLGCWAIWRVSHLLLRAVSNAKGVIQDNAVIQYIL